MDVYFTKTKKLRGGKKIDVEVPKKSKSKAKTVRNVEERDPMSLNYLKKKYSTGTTKGKLQEANLMLQKRGKDISDILKKKKKEAEKQKGKEVVLPPEFYQLIKSLNPAALKRKDLPSTVQLEKEQQEQERRDYMEPLQRTYTSLLRKAFPDDEEKITDFAVKFSGIDNNASKLRIIKKLQNALQQDVEPAPRRQFQGVREVEQVPLEEEDFEPIGERVARRRRRQQAQQAETEEEEPEPAPVQRRRRGRREVSPVPLDTEDEQPIGRRAGRRQAPPRPPPRQAAEPETEIDNLLSAEENQDAIIQNPPYLDSLPDEQYLNALYNSTPDGLREYADRQGIDLTELPQQIDKAELAEYIMYQKRGRVPLFNPGGNPGLAGEGLFKKRGRGRPRKHPIKGSGFLDTVVDLGKKAYNFVKENPDAIKKGIEYGKKGVEVAKKGIDYYKASRKAKGGALMMPSRRGASTYQSYF